MSIADRIFEDGILEDENSRTDLNYGDRFCRADEVEYCYNKTEDKFETINEKNEKMGRMKEEFMQMRLEEQDQTHITMQEIAQEARDVMEKHHPIGQERYVDESEFQRNEIIDAMHDIAKQPSTNQLNNKMAKKTMQEKLTKQPEVVVETRTEALRRLYKENGLTAEDVFKDPRGFVIITRTGIDKISAKNSITIGYEVITMDIDKSICVLKAAGTMKGVDGTVRNVMSFGEASPANMNGGGKKFPVSMAEKRAMSRVVLKLTGFYEQGVFGQDEITDEPK